MEEHPGVIFSNTTAEKCWDMVLERLNKEIKRQSDLGKQALPGSQPLQTIDGLHMFGFSSQPIVQVKQPFFYFSPLFSLPFSVFFRLMLVKIILWSSVCKLIYLR